MLETKELLTFYQIARLKSFSKAAAELNYSQSTVTIQIQQLEHKLGVQLFNRIGKNISLTPKGEILYHHTHTILTDIKKAEDEIRGKEVLSGDLRIGTIESICSSLFPPLLSNFHERFPAVSMNITINSPDTLLKMLNNDQLDFIYIADKRIYSKSWLKVLEVPEDVAFIASSENPISQRKSVSLDEMLRETFILTERDASYRYMLDQYLQGIQKPLRPYMEIENTDFIINKICNNEGVSFLPIFAVQDELRAGKLKIITVDNFYMRIWRQVMFHRDKWITPEMEYFFETVKNTNSSSISEMFKKH